MTTLVLGLCCIAIALLIAVHGAFGVYGDPSEIFSVVMYCARMGLLALGMCLIWFGAR